MVTIENFKKFLGYSYIPQPALQAEKARGTLTLNRKSGITGIIPIPQINLTFFNSGNFYRSASPDNPTEIGESQTFVPFVIESVEMGSEQNISQTNQSFFVNATSDFVGPINFTAINESAITGGQDATKEIIGNKAFVIPEPDDRLQSCLNIGRQIVKAKIGGEVTDTQIDENEVLTECVFLAGAYRLKNTTTEDHIVSLGTEFENRQSFRDRMFAGVFSQIESMIDQSGIQRDNTAYV